MTLSLPLVEVVVVVGTSQLQLMTQGGGRHSSAPISKIGVSSGDSAKLSIALLVRGVAVVMRMLGAEAPAARLPKRALLLDVIGTRLVAFEAVGKLGFASLTSLA